MMNKPWGWFAFSVAIVCGLSDASVAHAQSRLSRRDRLGIYYSNAYANQLNSRPLVRGQQKLQSDFRQFSEAQNQYQKRTEAPNPFQRPAPAPAGAQAADPRPIPPIYSGRRGQYQYFGRNSYFNPAR